jgi:hypothetical protein
VSAALQVIDVTNPLTPIVGTYITNAGGWGAQLTWPLEVKVANGKAYVAGSYGFTVIDVSNPVSLRHITKVADTLSTAIYGARDIFIQGTKIYVVSLYENALSIFTESYKTTQPDIYNTAWVNYAWSLVTFTETMGAWNQWNSKYQISRDNGVTWYYHNGTAWTVAPSASYTFANTASQIHTNFVAFNSVGSGTSMKVRAFLNSNWSQKVEVDTLEFATSGAYPNITSYFPWDFKIIPKKDINFTFSYNDAIWINTSTDRLELRKWQAGSWGADIASTYINFAWKTVTTTNATYPSAYLPYGKYKMDFFIKNTLW